VDQLTARIVDEVNRKISRSYGHVGPQFVEFLITHRAKWSAWRKTYQQLEAVFLNRAEGNSILIRLTKHVALLDFTARLADAVLDLPWSYEPTIDELWNQVVADAEKADRDRQALAFAIGWAHSNSQAFFGRHRWDANDAPLQPPIGWAGAWALEEDWEVIGFFPHRLRAELKRAGYSPSTLRAWRDRGWLDTDAERGRLTKKTSFMNAPARLTLIRRDAINELTAD